MKGPVLGLASIVFACIVVACAASGEKADSALPAEDGGTVLVTDASDGTVSEDAPSNLGQAPRCSAAGWCKTEPPGKDFTIKDVWPLAGRAFAIADSDTRGVKVFEWDGALHDGQEWTFIDDETHNTGYVQASSIWAPNEDEVYFALTDFSIFAGGTLGSFVFHGKRPAAPGMGWSWTRHHFDCDGLTTPRVWGTSSDDVYVLSCNKVYHRELGSADAGVDSGAPGWVTEYVNDDPSQSLSLEDVTGSGPADVWLVGYRGAWPGACAVVVRKTAAGYQTVADGIVDPNDNCGERPGVERIVGMLGPGIHSPATGTLLTVRSSGEQTEALRIAARDEGGYSITSSRPGATISGALTSVWGTSDDDLWFIAARPARSGNVVRGTNLWSDGGAYQYSTIALNGAPNLRTLWRLRGASNTNIWAVGENVAFHKANP